MTAGYQDPPPGSECVLALVGPDEAAEAVVRHACRVARLLDAPWIALHVERPDSAAAARAPPQLAAQRATQLAAQLGAAVETVPGHDIAAAALDAARARNVTRIILGRSARGGWLRVPRYRVARAVLRAAEGCVVEVIPAAAPPPPAWRRLNWAGWPGWVGAIGLVAGTTVIASILSAVVSYDALGMVFLAGVVVGAAIWGLAVALPTAMLSFLAWNFFFIPPIHQFAIHQGRDVVAIVLFLGVATATGALASRVREGARTAQARVASLRRISAFSRSLGEPTGEPELLAEIARQAATIGGRAVVLTERAGDLNIRAADPRADTMDEAAWAAARWAFARQEPSGRGSATLATTEWGFLPLRTVRACWGLLGVRPARPLDPSEAQALASLADQAAIAMERVRLIAEAARFDAQQETQKLRTALLSSLSHDLRTPLAAIRGAAETLRTAWDRLTGATRADLLSSIEENTGRMTRFLGNIMDMTRLETGEVIPRLTRVDVSDALDHALLLVPDAAVIRDLPADLPPVTADPALFEQVLVNVIGNAVKFAPAGGPVAIGARRAGRHIELHIADDGSGIPEADLPHVFDSFYRVRRGDRGVPGSGLGLAIAQGLMTAMGGDIAARSPRPDRRKAGPPGTEIMLRLPIAP